MATKENKQTNFMRNNHGQYFLKFDASRIAKFL